MRWVRWHQRTAGASPLDTQCKDRLRKSTYLFEPSHVCPSDRPPAMQMTGELMGAGRIEMDSPATQTGSFITSCGNLARQSFQDRLWQSCGRAVDRCQAKAVQLIDLTSAVANIDGCGNHCQRAAAASSARRTDVLGAPQGCCCARQPLNADINLSRSAPLAAAYARAARRACSGGSTVAGGEKLERQHEEYLHSAPAKPA